MAFLDRDGVINEEINYLHKISDFKYIQNSILALKIIQNLGFKIIIITNQAGIAKGLFSEEDYETLTNWLLRDLSRKGIEILDILHCPHHPEGIIPSYSYDCPNRKPGPGMILQAKEKFNINMQASFLVGDKESDLEAARRANLANYYLVESGHAIPKIKLEGNILKRNLYDVAKSLARLNE